MRIPCSSCGETGSLDLPDFDFNDASKAFNLLKLNAGDASAAKASFTSAHHAINRFDVVLTSLRKTVARVEKERNTLQTFLIQHETVLSPIESIPDDVLITIFRLYVDDPDVQLDMIMTLPWVSTPWLLGHVSRRWRKTSRSCPFLWADCTRLDSLDEGFPWPYHPFGKHETFTQELNLVGTASLRFVALGKLATIEWAKEAFLSRISQWRSASVSLNVLYDVDAASAIQNADKSTLESLSLIEYETGNAIVAPDFSLTTFCDTPNLHKLSITGTYITDVPLLLLPWKQITSLTLADVDMHSELIHSFLSYFTSLEILRVTNIKRPRQSHFPLLPTMTIPTLRMLEFDSFCRSNIALCGLVVPNLTHISVLSEYRPAGRPTEIWNIAALVECSKCCLRSVRGFSFSMDEDEDDTVSCMKELHTVENFYIEVQGRDSFTSLAQLLTFREDNQYVPSLAILELFVTIRWDQIDVIYQGIYNVIQSRYTSPIAKCLHRVKLFLHHASREGESSLSYIVMKAFHDRFNCLEVDLEIEVVSPSMYKTGYSLAFNQ